MKRVLWSFFILFLLCLPFAAQQAPEMASGSHSTMAKSAATGPEIWSSLMEGNKRFMSGKTKSRDLVAIREKLTQSQHPQAVVLTCSDSRVSPELLFDQSLGDLFVVRSAGNIADAIGVGSIEYAVEHLGSSVLVVLGHTKCGAVTAACSGEKMPTPGLQAIVDKINPAVEKVKGSAKPDDLVEAAIVENVHQSARDVVASSKVLQHFIEDGKLKVYEAEYQLDTGEVKKLGGQ